MKSKTGRTISGQSFNNLLTAAENGEGFSTFGIVEESGYFLRRIVGAVNVGKYLDKHFQGVYR